MKQVKKGATRNEKHDQSALPGDPVPDVQAPQRKAVRRRKEETPPPAPPEQEDEELKLKEALYVRGLDIILRGMKKTLDAHIDSNLRANGFTPERGNERQRQLRKMSWGFASLSSSKLPKGFEILPCAANLSEVYQMTHFIQAVMFSAQKLTQLRDQEAVITPLVKREENEITRLEAKKALYSFLLKQFDGEPIEVKEPERGVKTISLRDVYDLLMEIKEKLDEYITREVKAKSV